MSIMVCFTKSTSLVASFNTSLEATKSIIKYAKIKCRFCNLEIFQIHIYLTFQKKISDQHSIRIEQTITVNFLADVPGNLRVHPVLCVKGIHRTVLRLPSEMINHAREKGLLILYFQ